MLLQKGSYECIKRNIWLQRKALGKVFHVHERFRPTRKQLLRIAMPTCKVH